MGHLATSRGLIWKRKGALKAEQELWRDKSDPWHDGILTVPREEQHRLSAGQHRS